MNSNLSLNLSATSAMMFTLVKLVVVVFVREYEHLGKSILTEKNLKYIEADCTAIRKHCDNHFHTADTSCFSLVGNAANKCHLKGNESLLISTFKPLLNVAEESMLLCLFQYDL